MVLVTPRYNVGPIYISYLALPVYLLLTLPSILLTNLDIYFGVGR